MDNEIVCQPVIHTAVFKMKGIGDVQAFFLIILVGAFGNFSSILQKETASIDVSRSEKAVS